MRLDLTTTAGLLDQSPHQLFRVPFTTLVRTRELLAVSVTLGALSTLFAAAAVQQQEPRTQLPGRSLDRIRLALDDFEVYQTARDHAHDLIASSTGATNVTDDVPVDVSPEEHPHGVSVT